MQRGLLWGKLLNSGVNGKVLHVIRDMYAKAKSCVKTRHGLSQFFLSQTLVCVRGKILYLFLLLYADDTIVLAECPEDLQRALDILKIYCELWGLDINVRKTKVMIFSRGKIRKMPKFNFNEETVDVVWDYKYLGVKFNYNNKFKKAQQ